MAAMPVYRLCGNDPAIVDDSQIVDLGPGEAMTFEAVWLQPPRLPVGSYLLTLHYKNDPQIPCDPCLGDASLRLRMSTPLEIESNALRVVFTSTK